MHMLKHPHQRGIMTGMHIRGAILRSGHTWRLHLDTTLKLTLCNPLLLSRSIHVYHVKSNTGKNVGSGAQARMHVLCLRRPACEAGSP